MSLKYTRLGELQNVHSTNKLIMNYRVLKFPQIPKLLTDRRYSVFKNFPSPGKLKQHLSRTCG